MASSSVRVLLTKFRNFELYKYCQDKWVKVKYNVDNASSLRLDFPRTKKTNSKYQTTQEPSSTFGVHLNPLSVFFL